MDIQLVSLIEGSALDGNVNFQRRTRMDKHYYEYDDDDDDHDDNQIKTVKLIKEENFEDYYSGNEEEEEEEEENEQNEQHNEHNEHSNTNQQQHYVKDLNRNKQPISALKETSPINNNNNNENLQSLLNTIKELEKEISSQHQQLTDAQNAHANNLLNRERLHKEELEQLHERHALSLRNKDNEIKTLRETKLHAFDKEKQNLISAHANALSALHSNYTLRLKQQQVELEQQHNMLQQQLEQQIALNNIISKVESSSTNINAVVDKLSQQQQAHTSLESVVKEKNISLENKLKQMEEDLRTAREAFALEKSQYEASQTEKCRLLLVESQTIQNELSQLEKLRTQVEAQQQSMRDKFATEKGALNAQCDKTHCELTEMKASFSLKFNELQQLTQLLREEKALFEKHKQEQLSIIDNKKNTYEQQHIAFIKEHNDIRQRILFLQEQEQFYKEQHAKCEQEKEDMKQREMKIGRQKEDLFIAAKRIDDSIKLLQERHMAVERESETVRKQLDEVDDERVKMGHERLRLEQERSDLRMREQAVEMMRRKYVQPMIMKNNDSSNSSKSINGNWRERILKEKEYLTKASKTEYAFYSNYNN